MGDRLLGLVLGVSLAVGCSAKEKSKGREHDDSADSTAFGMPDRVDPSPGPVATGAQPIRVEPVRADDARDDGKDDLASVVAVVEELQEQASDLEEIASDPTADADRVEEAIQAVEETTTELLGLLGEAEGESTATDADSAATATLDADSAEAPETSEDVEEPGTAGPTPPDADDAAPPADDETVADDPPPTDPSDSGEVDGPEPEPVPTSDEVVTNDDTQQPGTATDTGTDGDTPSSSPTLPPKVAGALNAAEQAIERAGEYLEHAAEANQEAGDTPDFVDSGKHAGDEASPGQGKAGGKGKGQKAANAAP